MVGRGLSGSAVKYFTALSPFNVEGAGSTGVVDAANFQSVTAIVASASDDLVVNLERSSASDGTFAQFGASIPGNASGVSVRTIFLQSSATWLKASYSMEPNASAISSIVLLLQGARRIPVAQDANTNVYSDVVG